DCDPARRHPRAVVRPSRRRRRLLGCVPRSFAQAARDEPLRRRRLIAGGPSPTAGSRPPQPPFSRGTCAFGQAQRHAVGLIFAAETSARELPMAAEPLDARGAAAAANAPLALEIRRLAKAFEHVHAVNGLDLAIPPGELHALLGPNGAGKTTTLRIVAGLLRADEGKVLIMGHDVATDPLAAKRVLAFLPDDPLLYGKLTPFEYLEFVAGLWNVDASRAAAAADDLLRWLELYEKRGHRIETFSRGMRQKVALA